MQVTLELDPEVYNLASHYAESHGFSLSDAFTHLVRQAEQPPHPVLEPPRFIRKDGLLVVAATGHPLTPEMVKEASEDLLVW